LIIDKSIVSILVEWISLLLLLIVTVTLHVLSRGMPHRLCETHLVAVVVLVILGGVAALVYIGVEDVVLVVLHVVGQIFVICSNF